MVWSLELNAAPTLDKLDSFERVKNVRKITVTWDHSEAKVERLHALLKTWVSNLFLNGLIL